MRSDVGAALALLLVAASVASAATTPAAAGPGGPRGAPPPPALPAPLAAAGPPTPPSACCAMLAAAGFTRSVGVPVVLIDTAAGLPTRTKQNATLCTCGAGEVGVPGAGGQAIGDWAGPIKLKVRGGTNTRKHDRNGRGRRWVVTSSRGQPQHALFFPFLLHRALQPHPPVRGLPVQIRCAALCPGLGRRPPGFPRPGQRHGRRQGKLGARPGPGDGGRAPAHASAVLAVRDLVGPARSAGLGPPHRACRALFGGRWQAARVRARPLPGTVPSERAHQPGEVQAGPTQAQGRGRTHRRHRNLFTRREGPGA
jgi:hypothetical protein